MQIISGAQETVLKILGAPRVSEKGYRLIRYAVDEVTEDGVLLFNLLTRELLLLSEAEFTFMTKNDVLREKWFLVPEDFDEMQSVDTVRWVLENTKKKSTHITSYTILPSSDCNARCFYCFEKGQPRIHMTEAVARRTATYIAEHAGGQNVFLSWFGGEPLCNLPVIDYISDALRKDGIVFSSRMTSNGYLFNDETIKKAKENWNLKNVQITLDGTEDVYNKTKAYIYREGSPYQKVLSNIEKLADAGILVIIRLNMDLYNAENLLELIDELGSKFADRREVIVYANHIFNTEIPLSQLHSHSEWKKRHAAMCRIENKLRKNNLSRRVGIAKKLKTNHCMADCGHAVVIAPTGDISLREHYIFSEHIGSIYKPEFDLSRVEIWKIRPPKKPECAECFYYPECTMLQKCSVNNTCFPVKIEENRMDTKGRMLWEYRRFLEKKEPDDEEDTAFC